VDRGRVDILPCEAVLALFGARWSGGRKLDAQQTGARWSHRRPPAEPSELLLTRADATPEASLKLPRRSAPSVMTAPLAVRLAASSGHLRPLYRPPLQLAVYPRAH